MVQNTDGKNYIVDDELSFDRCRDDEGIEVFYKNRYFRYSENYTRRVIVRVAIINNCRAECWCCRLDFFYNRKKIAVKYIISVKEELVYSADYEKIIEEHSSKINKAIRKIVDQLE